MSAAQGEQTARSRGYRGSTLAQRLGSAGVSLILHASLLAAIIFLSSAPVKRYNLDTPMLSLRQLTIGAAGPIPEKQPEVGQIAAPPPETPVPETVEPPPPVPVEEPPAPEIPAEPPVPVPEIPEEPPVPVPEIPEESPAEEAPAEPEPLAEETPVEPEPAAEPPVEEKPAGPTDAELLAAALAEAQAEARPAPKVSGGRSLLDEALKNAGNAAKTERIVTGESGSGVGILASYEEVVAMEIRKRFITHYYADGRVYEMTALIEIAADGTLASYTVRAHSGDPSFDAKVQRAVRDVGRFEPPPGKKAQKLELSFSSDMYAGL